MPSSIDAQSVVRFHDHQLVRPEWPLAQPGEARDGAWRWIEANHRCNGLLWREEDKARRVDVDPAEIAAGKRLIDQFNQQRNDAVEAMDEAILAELASVSPGADARLSSETAGAMIDRLSILALKIHHMGVQAQRADAGAAHVQGCAARLQRLRAQRQDLASCLDRLLAEAGSGSTYFKVYRQFKMYNDPTLNPWLYGSRRDATGQAPS
jgi:hypothetical protein